MSLPVIVIGGGGHAKVLIEILLLSSVNVLAVIEIEKNLIGKKVCGIPIIDEKNFVFKYKNNEVELINGIGSTKSPVIRKNIFEKYKRIGFNFANVQHPSAVVSSDVILNEGVQIMAGAIIQISVKIDCNSIINTKASVDHDCIIGKHVHLAPGVTLSGGIKIGDVTHVGTGTNIVQNVKIGNNVTIGAGSLVLDDIQDNEIVMGSPARIRRDII